MFYVGNDDKISSDPLGLAKYVNALLDVKYREIHTSRTIMSEVCASLGGADNTLSH